MEGMTRDPFPDHRILDVDASIAGTTSRLGTILRTERRRQDLTLAELAAAAGVSTTSVHAVESGRRATIGMYVRLAQALGKRLVVDLGDPVAMDIARAHDADAPIGEHALLPMGRDIVHAAMGELEAARLLAHGWAPGIDVPWQHFRFGGRADVITCDIERLALLHIENKTQLPDLQDGIGRFQEKQAYLGRAVWERLGLARPPLIQTHVMVGLWSAEVIDVVRRSPATFRSAFPATPDAFLTWWSGGVPGPGTTSAFVLLDPFARGRVARFAGLREVLAGVQPRVLGYAAAADLVRHGQVRVR